MSLSSTSKLFCAESSHDTSHATTDRNPEVPPIQVPKPPPILSRLLEAGAPKHLAQEMHTVYLDHAKKLRTHYIAVLSRLRRDLPRLPTSGVDTFRDHLVPLLLRMYAKALQDWVREGVDMFQTRRLPAHKRPFNQAFNHHYVPLLEHFFDDNPFPTHADKAFLARESGMSYQQIHVWFQNRRSRSRKVGKVLRKKSVSEGTVSPACMDGCVTKPGETVVDKGCDEPKKFDPLGPLFDYYPVGRLGRSVQTELKFNSSWWPRRPSSAKPGHSSFDMDGLVEKFSRLSVRRDRTGGRSKKLQDGSCSPPAATSFITVTPPPAPHPALVRRRDVSLPPLPPLVVPRTCASRSSRLQAFNAPSPSPSSNLLASLTVSHFPESPRKRLKVISNDSSHHEASSIYGARPTLKCDLASSRTPQRTPHSTYLPTRTTPDYVTPKEDGPWVCSVEGLRNHSFAAVRALSQHTILPWDFRFAVTV